MRPQLLVFVLATACVPASNSPTAVHFAQEDPYPTTTMRGLEAKAKAAGCTVEAASDDELAATCPDGRLRVTPAMHALAVECWVERVDQCRTLFARVADTTTK